MCSSCSQLLFCHVSSPSVCRKSFSLSFSHALTHRQFIALSYFCLYFGKLQNCWHSLVILITPGSLCQLTAFSLLCDDCSPQSFLLLSPQYSHSSHSLLTFNCPKAFCVYVYVYFSCLEIRCRTITHGTRY